MFKHVNIKGIIILIVILAVIQYGVALGLSPMLKTVIVDGINKSSGSKVEIQGAHIWPLTFSFSLRGLKVYDPKDNEKIAEIGKASVRLSFLALLSKRIVISSLTVGDADIFLRREADGSFNIQQLGESPPAEGAAEKPATSIFDRFKGKQDWFGKIYDAIKKKSSKEAVDTAKQERAEAGKVKREVTELPRGKRVAFKTTRDDYLFEIRNLSVKNAAIHLEAEDGQKIDIEKAKVRLEGVAMDPKKGVAFNGLSVKGQLEKGGASAGSFLLEYARNVGRKDIKTEVDVDARDIDMAAVNFIYKDSLPVTVEKGTLSLKSKTDIINGDLNSKNSLSLKGQQLAAKSGGAAVGFIPMPILVDAMNKVDPLSLKFDITGTVDKPHFSNFQDSLKELVKPYIADVKEQGVSAVKSFLKEKLGGEEAAPDASASSGGSGEDAAQKAADSIKSLFGK